MKWNQETRALQCGREDVVSNGWAMPIFAYMFILAFFVAMIMGSPTVPPAIWCVRTVLACTLKPLSIQGIPIKIIETN
jgi:hypothetical protein